MQWLVQILKAIRFVRTSDVYFLTYIIKEEVVLREMGEYINEGMHKILLQIDQFYTDKNLKHP